MKRLLRLLPLLLLCGAMTHAMDKMGASISRYDPFMQIPLPNAPKLSEEKILLLIKDGKYDDLVHEILNGLEVKYKFTKGEYEGKSLLQVALGHSIANRYGIPNRHEIASMLLKRGASSEDLNPFLNTAIKRIDPAEVKWLLDHGAKPAPDAHDVVITLEKATQNDKKEKIIQIKNLLEEWQSKRPAKPVTVAESRPRVEQPKVRTELPVVKVKFDKKDLFTVLGSSEEQKLLKAVLSGDDKKLAEYLEMGLSPDFVFTQGSPGKSVLKVVVTESLKNQEKLADLLLAYDANKQSLQDGLALAIQRFEKPKVEWLLAKGAQPTDELLKQVEVLQKATAHPVKQKIVTEIKTLLKASAQVTQFNKPLPPVPAKKPVVAESIESVKNIYGNKK